MSVASLAALTALFFVASLMTVVTGSTSLITVPVMLQFGIEPRTVVATNMFALAMLSLGGVLPFVRARNIDRARAPWLLALTVAGSVAGAFLLFAVPPAWLTLVIPLAMIAVLIVLLLHPQTESSTVCTVSPARSRAGYIVVAALGVYGGFFSGGYSTLITIVGIVMFRYPLLRSAAMSRLLNAVSSFVAVVLFAWRGIIDWRLGIFLGIAAFAGGLIGSHYTQKIPAALLRRLFMIVVALLAAKALIFDVPWRSL